MSLFPHLPTHPQTSATELIMKPVKNIFAIITVCWTATAWPYDFRPTPFDFALAPDYCKAKLSDPGIKHLAGKHVRYSQQQRESWKKRIGPDWAHMHHYCWGVAYISRARTGKGNRTAATSFELAIPQIEYTRNQSKPGYPLWIPMTIDLAEAYEGSGNRAKAIDLLLELRKTSGKAPEVHVALARTLSRAHKTSDAIKVLEQARTTFDTNGPILFYLAYFYYDAGYIERAIEYSRAAQKAGMKMDLLNERLPGEAAEPD